MIRSFFEKTPGAVQKVEPSEASLKPYSNFDHRKAVNEKSHRGLYTRSHIGFALCVNIHTWASVPYTSTP